VAPTTLRCVCELSAAVVYASVLNGTWTLLASCYSRVHQVLVATIHWPGGMTVAAVRQITLDAGCDTDLSRLSTFGLSHEPASNVDFAHTITATGKELVTAVHGPPQHTTGPSLPSAVDCTANSIEDETLLPTTMGMGIEDPGWDLLPDICTHADTADASELHLNPTIDQHSTDHSKPLSPVFSCKSPTPPHAAQVTNSSPSSGKKRPRARDIPRGSDQKRSRARFGTVAHVRRLTVGMGTLGRAGATASDDYEPMKQHDGPSRVSVLISALLVAFFGKGCCSVEQLLRSLGAETALEICEWGQELFERCRSLAERLKAGGCVGILPSNVRLTAVHSPGVQQLATWLQPQSSMSAEAVASTGKRAA